VDKYGEQLPNAFPYVVKLTRKQAQEAVAALMDDDRQDVQLGSSFAITIDYSTYMNYLWMSEATFAFCYNAMLEGMWKTKNGFHAPKLMYTRDFKSEGF